jgi:hypothetical protein
MTGDVFHELALRSSPGVSLDALPGLGGKDTQHVVKVLIDAFGDVLIDHRTQGLVSPCQVSHQIILGRAGGPIQFAQISQQEFPHLTRVHDLLPG